MSNFLVVFHFGIWIFFAKKGTLILVLQIIGYWSRWKPQDDCYLIVFYLKWKRIILSDFDKMLCLVLPKYCQISLKCFEKLPHEIAFKCLLLAWIEISMSVYFVGFISYFQDQKVLFNCFIVLINLNNFQSNKTGQFNYLLLIVWNLLLILCIY